MSNRRGEHLQEFAFGVGVFGLGAVILGGALGVVVGGVFDFVFGALLGIFSVGVVALGVNVWGRRRGSQTPAGLRTVPPLAPTTLRWVRGLLPDDEGAAWLAEVTSCLAETTDKSERCRYVCSYRRKVPQLIWTSWTERLSASRQRELL